MTDKFQSYVDNIQEKNKFKLLLIPILVVVLIMFINQLLILPLIFIFNDSLKDARNQFEVEFIKSKSQKCKGNLSEASIMLNISKRQLNNKILEYKE